MNLYENAVATQDITPASASTASNNGTAVDWSGYRQALAIIHVGALSAGGSLVATIDESDASNMTPFVAVDTLTITEGSKAHQLGVRRQASSKKYQRVRVQRTGTSMMGATLIHADPQQGPAT